MALISYTLGNTNAFAYGDSTKVTAGVSNTATLGATNALTIGTSTSFSLAGTFAASIGGSVAMSYTGALSVSYGKTITYSLTSTTQARDNITLKGGSGAAALTAWGGADVVIRNIKILMGVLSIANAGLAGYAIETATEKGASDFDTFHKTTGMVKSTVISTTATISSNLVAAVAIAAMLKGLATKLGAITQVGKLVLDDTGAALTGTFDASTSSVTLGSSAASMSNVVPGTTSSGLNLGGSSSTLNFVTGDVTAPTGSSALLLDNGSAQLSTGPTTGPKFKLNGLTPGIKGTLSDTPADSNFFQLSMNSFYATSGVGAKGALSLSQTASSLIFQSPGGDNGIGMDGTGVAVTSAGSKINASPTGVTVNGTLIRLG